ncbi:MAG: GNAT family N-acetyltransferase [Candidatus Altiarchaeota archaeon]|nr:GNAT family N-acetyltransferase [Candidatus Altiarchaeota archaeon]
MKVRFFRPSDGRRCHYIIKKCLFTVNKKEDSLATRKNLAKNNTPKRLLEKNSMEKIYVAEDKNKVVGIIGIDDVGIIHHLFVDPRYHGKGIGSALLQKTITTAKKHKLKKVTTHSSILADGFYKKHGFKRIRKHTRKWLNSKITYIKMEKKI